MALVPRRRSALLRLSPSFWIFIIAFAVRIAVLIQISGSPYFLPDAGDMKFYSDWAIRVAHGQWTDFQAFYGLPGYAYLLAAIFSVIGNVPAAVPTTPDLLRAAAFDRSLVVGLLQSLCEAATAVLIFKIALCVFASRDLNDKVSRGDGSSRHVFVIGCIAAAGWITFPPAQAYSLILMPTSWLVLAFWFSVWSILRIDSPSLWRPWLRFGLTVGVMAMMVATILFLIPLFLAAIWRHLGAGRGVKRGVLNSTAAGCVLMAGVLLGLSPCALHNYFVAKEPVLLSAHSGINFWIGNNPRANGYPRIPQGLRSSQEGLLKDSISVAEAEAGKKLSRTEVGRSWSLKAKAYIRDHPREWGALMATKFKNFWNTFRYDDLSSLTVFRQHRLLLPGLTFGFIAAFALPGMLMAAWMFPQSRWVVAAIILHMLSLMPVFVTERYRLAVVPGLLLMFAFCLYVMWNSLRLGRWPLSIAGAAACSAAAWFVSQPQPDNNLWSLDYHNAGIKALGVKDLKLAEKNLRQAYSYVQTNAEINFALGNLALEKNLPNEAKTWFEAALRIDGGHHGAWNNLGAVAVGEQNWPYAEKFLLEALRTEQDDPKTHYLLARVWLETGRLDRAAEAIQRALSLQPADAGMRRLAQEINDRQR